MSAAVAAARLSVLHVGFSAAGSFPCSAVVVYRDATRNGGDVYLALPAYVVPRASSTLPLALSDADDKPLGGARTHVATVAMIDDRVGLALLRLPLAPSVKVRVAGLATQAPRAGDSTYSVGCPAALAPGAVVFGNVAHPSWSGATQTWGDDATKDFTRATSAPNVARTLVARPTLEFDHGAAVFDAQTHLLLGIAAGRPRLPQQQGAMVDGLLALVPAAAIRKALLALQYEARPRPWPVAANDYCIPGLGLMPLSRAESSALAAQNSALLGRAGVGFVIDPSLMRPDARGRRELRVPERSDAGFKTMDVLWAVAPQPRAVQPDAWTFTSTSVPAAEALASLDPTRSQPWRESISSTNVATRKAATIPVVLVVAGYTDGAEEHFTTVVADLVPRSDALAAAIATYKRTGAMADLDYVLAIAEQRMPDALLNELLR